MFSQIQRRLADKLPGKRVGIDKFFLKKG